MGATEYKTDVLSKFIYGLTKEILKAKDCDKNTVTLGVLTSAIKGRILKDSNTAKTKREEIDQILNILLKKKDLMLKVKNDRIEELKKRSSRRLYSLYAFIFVQMMFTQYGTYVRYSWDIMEPICCLFGILDSIFGYWYFIMRDHNFNFKVFEDDFIDQKVSTQLGREINFKEEFEDVQRMIEHMKMNRILVCGEDLEEIVEALDEKFRKY